MPPTTANNLKPKLLIFSASSSFLVPLICLETLGYYPTVLRKDKYF